MRNWTVSLAVAVSYVTEGAAWSPVLKVAQVMPSRGKHWLRGFVPKSSNDPAIALQPVLAPERRKDAMELKERPAA